MNHTYFEAMKWMRAFVSSATEGSLVLGDTAPDTRCLPATAEIDWPLSSMVTVGGLVSWLSSSVEYVICKNSILSEKELRLVITGITHGAKV